MARIARRGLRLQNLPLFSLQKPWHDVTGELGKLPLNLFEPRYVELARRIEPPDGSGQFGYTDVTQRRRHGRGMLAEASDFQWVRSEGPVQLVASGMQRFRILSIRTEEVKDGAPPLHFARVQLLADRDLARLPADRSADMSIPSEVPSSIFGQVYVQKGGWGFASYHFDREGPYISYESGLANDFPALDDGSKPPPKKLFEDAKYDHASRTFRGHITWNPTWQGAERWDYEMVFSSDLSAIVGGSVQWTTKNGKDNSSSRFGVDLYYNRLKMDIQGTEEAVAEALVQSGLTSEAGLEYALERRKGTMQQRKHIRHALKVLRKTDLSEACGLGAVDVVRKLGSPPNRLHAAETALHSMLLCCPEALRRDVESALLSCWERSGDVKLDDAFEHAKQLVDQERLDDALTALKKVTDMAPNFAEAWHKRAVVQFNMGNHNEAIDDCKKALEMKPRHFGALAIVGMCKIAVRQKADATNWFRAALAVHPGMHGARNLLEEIEVGDLIDTHLKPRMDRVVSAYNHGDLLPTSSSNLEGAHCSWDVRRLELKLQPETWAYFFRVRIKNSSTQSLKSRARFYVLNATDGKVFSFARPTSGDAQIRLQPGEEHKFCWVLRVGRELQAAASGTLLEAPSSNAPSLLVEELTPLLMFGTPEVSQSELEQLTEGYVFNGVLDLRSIAEF